jgi:multicomponent K+:H+ antiporter subunit F
VALAAWRLLRGPTLPDRILALDTLYINALALLVVLGLWLGTQVLFRIDAADRAAGLHQHRGTGALCDQRGGPTRWRWASAGCIARCRA